MANPVSDLFTGISLLPRGLNLLARRPKLLGRGLLPPILTSLLLLGALIALAVNSGRLADWLTPFADDWTNPEALRAVVAALLVVCGVLLLVLTFSALTLALGGPIYDTIAEALERDLGDLPPEQRQRFVASAGRAVLQTVALLVLSVLLAVGVFLIGLIPVVGTVVAAVLGACLGGWLVALDMVGTVFERRGMFRLGQRNARLRGRPLLTLGFCVPTFVLLSVPLLAIAVFPVAKAGATLLAREVLAGPGEPGRPRSGAAA